MGGEVINNMREGAIKSGEEDYVAMQNGSHLKKNDRGLSIVLACYYPLLVEGVCKILESDKSIQVVSKISNVLDLVQACEGLNFDILLLDVDLQGLNLSKVLQLLKKNKAAKVILVINGDY